MHTDTAGSPSGESSGSTISDINKRTGRNMPQAVATAVMLIALLVAAMLIRIDLLVWVIVIFMLLALWELRVDFAVINLHIPLVTLGICCTLTLAATFYAPHHVLAAVIAIAFSVVVVAMAASHQSQTSNMVASAVAGKPRSAVSTGDRPESGQGFVAYSGSASSAAGDAERMQGNTAVAWNVSVSVFLVLYIAALASCIILPFTFGGHPVAHAIMVVFLPAVSDTGGLFMGAWLGKHKLSPRISPKKSYEGLAGSILFTMVGAFIIFAVTYPDRWASLWWAPIVIGVVVGVVGTFGDLCASMLKRDIGIKDMGHLLKGHGGVMDRVDSILLCAPFFTAFLWVIGL